MEEEEKPLSTNINQANLTPSSATSFQLTYSSVQLYDNEGQTIKAEKPATKQFNKIIGY